MMDRQLAADLGVALERGEMFPVFQPQVSLEQGAVVAVEALCRWRHPERGLIPPDQFIPLAEKTGLVLDIGMFMLDECLSAIDGWREDGSDVEVSVNVSPLQLAMGSFAEYLADELRHRALPTNALTIEITESLPVLDLATIVPRLDDLRSLGVGVALDDFGTGHASEGQLERLPITELKLDRSLIQSADPVPGDPLSETVARAQDRGLRIVAEGVETDAHLEVARRLHCDRAQGYLLGMPMPKADLDALLAA